VAALPRCRRFLLARGSAARPHARVQLDERELTERKLRSSG
jgi:hypothetical protein